MVVHGFTGFPFFFVVCRWFFMAFTGFFVVLHAFKGYLRSFFMTGSGLNRGLDSGH